PAVGVAHRDPAHRAALRVRLQGYTMGSERPISPVVLVLVALSAGDTVLLDLGVYTLDALKLVDGNFNPEALEHATWEDAGLNVHVRQPILRTLKAQSDEFGGLTVDDVDLVIRQGLTTGDYTLRVAGYEVELLPLIDKHRERYAGWIANNICDGVFNGFRGVKSVILVGGGAEMVEP